MRNPWVEWMDVLYSPTLFCSMFIIQLLPYRYKLWWCEMTLYFDITISAPTYLLLWLRTILLVAQSPPRSLHFPPHWWDESDQSLHGERKSPPSWSLDYVLEVTKQTHLRDKKRTLKSKNWTCYVQAAFLTSENKIIRRQTTQQMQSRIKTGVFGRN